MGIDPVTIALVSTAISGGTAVYSSKQQRKAQKSQQRFAQAQIAEQKAEVKKAEVAKVEEKKAAQVAVAEEKKSQQLGGFTGLASPSRNLVRREAKKAAELPSVEDPQKKMVQGGYSNMLASSNRNLLRRQARRGFLSGQAGGRFGI